MLKQYHVQLIQQGKNQTLPIPEELNLATSFVTIYQEDGKLIIEPESKKSLLEVLSNLEPLEADFPDVDEDLLPLDDIDL
jgi:antitoxin VapB